MTLVLKHVYIDDASQRSQVPVDIVIEGDRIVEIRRDVEVVRGAEVIDGSGQLVLPGMTNAHTHAHANLVKATATNWSLEDLLNYGPAVYGHRTPEEHYLSAVIGAIEMVRSGCTSAYDLFAALPVHDDEALDAVAQAYEDVGLRATIAPAMADIPFLHSVPGLHDRLPADLQNPVTAQRAPSTAELLAITDRFISRWHGRSNGLISAGIAPTIPGQCTDEFLIGCRDLSREHGVSTHTHLAESKVQTDQAYRRWGTSIVEALDNLEVLSPLFVGAHAIWLSKDDIARLADQGATVAHNPASNLRLGNGVCPVRLLRDASVNIAIGTDGSISSDNQNMYEAMKLAALVSSLPFPYQQDRWLSASEVHSMATASGAQALGLAGTIGSVEVGLKADLALIDGDSTNMRPRGDLNTSLVYSETGASVRSTIVDGRVIMRDGVLETVTEASLLDRAARAAEHMAERNQVAWELPERVRPHLTAACRDAYARPYFTDYAWTVQGGSP